MIFQAINCIENQLKQNPPDIKAVAGNIGEIIAGGNSNNIDEDIIISLVNVEENRISRDPRNYLKSGTDLLLKNPAVHLNLTMLFTAMRSESAYGSALQNLQRVIQFFQGKNVFDHTNTPTLDTGIEKLILEMVSLNQEQLHQLWSMLGGRYQPSVVYCMRMVTIDSVSNVIGSIVKEIEANYYVK
jgi:Pvc16 N-terminal domain